MYEGYLSQLGLHDDFIYRIIIDDFNDQQLRRSAVIMTFLDCLGRQYHRQPRRRDDPLTRRPYADILADSRAHTSWLLAAPDNNTQAGDSRHQSLELKLMIFLWIMAYGEPQRNTAYRFKVSQSTVSDIFSYLIDFMRYLHTKFVRMPDHRYVSPRIELNTKFCQFNGAIGAVDGTHIPAFIPLAHQQRFWSRKSTISQNIFAAVDFEGRFLYVLAGAKGSINDATLIGYAHNGSFKVPPGRFFLANAGFGSRRGILIPFTRVRYHLQDWGDAAKRPVNEIELYNLRHAQLRTIVEQAFGRCKRKWKIIRNSAPEYSFSNQIKIIYAVTGLYNFLAFEGKEPELGHEEEGLPSWEIRALRRARRRADMVVTGRSGIDMRSLIANWLWSTYQAYLELQNDSESEEIDEEGSVVEEVEDGDEIEVIAEEADQREAISSSQELD
ncbi:uncharacterized protein FFUJ_02954 [Fusarium fujikuroi IMI 58289]|uniref:DDE Tnp4 domain-containing protein n=1 Tax=Gibberella fujikuroi (strain CBS 195.34 / IMI 58289 / NRRL A-6831) TaxID=1279085 RepID=S0DZQ4_GIBF5|nr:uncharacterized protein FFUJ_02954 [Fusarium fujikuroi IMI 58289]CCT65963.1 uncharacterized protein FFUJ_02954 [Fusarium fujikuroi IMI 58289]SCN79485.1 uncharacterized protein FFM5_02119 [Fusarium fujikuroi]